MCAVAALAWLLRFEVMLRRQERQMCFGETITFVSEMEERGCRLGCAYVGMKQRV